MRARNFNSDTPIAQFLLKLRIATGVAVQKSASHLRAEFGPSPSEMPGAAANFQGRPSDTAIKGAAVEPHSPVTEVKEDDKLDNVGRGPVRLSVLRWLCSRAVGKKTMATRASSHSQLVADIARL
jgi:hypothetical protein